MESVKQPSVPNSSSVTGGSLQGQNHFTHLAVDGGLEGKREIIPISIEIGRFIKEEFSKIK